MRKTIFAVAIAAAVTGCDGHTEVTAKITEPVARAKALSLIPGGTVISTELTSALHQPGFSFDIKRPGSARVEEVEISALTGKVIRTHHETPKEQAIEASQEPNLIKR
jgi:uncharacterized membrane protein YkoI